MNKDEPVHDDGRDASLDSERSDDESAAHFKLQDLITTDDGAPRMTLGEIEEAIRDDSHPRHEEAVQRNKELAARLAPSLQAFQKQVGAQLDFSKAFKIPSLEDLGVKGVVNAALKGAGTPPMRESLESVESRWEPTKSAAASLAIAAESQRRAAEMGENLRQAAQEKAERQRRQDETSAAQLETMEAMAATIQQLSVRVESVDDQLRQGNKSSKISFGWTITISALTLAVSAGLPLLLR